MARAISQDDNSKRSTLTLIPLGPRRGTPPHSCRRGQRLCESAYLSELNAFLNSAFCAWTAAFDDPATGMASRIAASNRTHHTAVDLETIRLQPRRRYRAVCE